MYKETYSIWLQNSIHNEKVYELIKRYAKEEDKDSFFPHVTLVSHIDSEEKALKILNKLSILFSINGSCAEPISILNSSKILLQKAWNVVTFSL